MEKRVYPSLEEGRLLPLVESFYTIQGEGFHTGKPAFFIRLGGCDVGCSWCDSKESWNPDRFPPVEVEKIVAEAVSFAAKAIVITGGEPMNYPLDILCNLLKQYGMEIFLETSGSSPFSGCFDWICLSPKRKTPPLECYYEKADELKVIIEEPADFEWAEKNREAVLKVNDNCLFYMQPEWSRMSRIAPKIVEYVKAHPEWNISVQTHKFLRIP